MPIDNITRSDKVEKSKDDGGQNPAEEFRQEVFRLQTDNGTGTAFRAPDGRLVTTYRNIAGCSEIFAVQNDKRYRVGKRLIIDDINDLAIMEFVDQPPAPSRALRVSGTIPESGTQLTAIGYPRNFFSQSDVQCSRQIRSSNEIQQKHFKLELFPETKTPVDGSRVFYDDRNVRDARSFLERPLLKLNADVSTLKGGPIVSQQGDVVGVNAVGNREYGGAIPARKLADLLSLESEQSPFSVKSDYETGIRKYIRDWGQFPVTQTAKTALAVVMAGLSLSKQPVVKLFPFMGACVLLNRDKNAYDSATDDMQKNHFAFAMGGDATSVAGLAMSALSNRWRPLGLTVAAAGMALRLGSEMMPYRYVIQSIERKDGDKRAPFDPTPRLFCQPIR